MQCLHASPYAQISVYTYHPTRTTLRAHFCRPPFYSWSNPFLDLVPGCSVCLPGCMPVLVLAACLCSSWLYVCACPGCMSVLVLAACLCSSLAACLCSSWLHVCARPGCMPVLVLSVLFLAACLRSSPGAQICVNASSSRFFLI